MINLNPAPLFLSGLDLLLYASEEVEYAATVLQGVSDSENGVHRIVTKRASDEQLVLAKSRLKQVYGDSLPKRAQIALSCQRCRQVGYRLMVMHERSIVTISKVHKRCDESRPCKR